MKTVTPTLDDRLLESSRRIADDRGERVEQYLGDVLKANALKPARPPLEDLFDLINTTNAGSGGGGWRRESVYDASKCPPIARGAKKAKR